MQDTLRDGLATIVVFVPKLLLFIIILLIGWLIAKALAKATDKVLEKVGFDRAVERGGIKKALAQSQYDASSIVGQLVFFTLMLFVLQLAFGVFGPNPISELLTTVIAFLPKAIVAIIILVVAAAIAAAIRELIANTLGGLSYGKALANIAAAFIIGLGIIAALNQVEVATTVTLPVLIAVLATIGGILVVGVGGGLIKPMQHRWEGYLETLATETQRVKAEADQAPSVTQQAKQAKAHADAQQAQPSPHTQPVPQAQQAPHHTSGAAADETVVFDRENQ